MIAPQWSNDRGNVTCGDEYIGYLQDMSAEHQAIVIAAVNAELLREKTEETES